MWVMVQRIRRQLMRLLGTIPIGYADGWTRDYKVSTLLLGWPAFSLLLGVCLWTRSLFDLLRFIPLELPVTPYVGENGEQSITATEVAEKRGTINYEVPLFA